MFFMWLHSFSIKYSTTHMYVDMAALLASGDVGVYMVCAVCKDVGGGWGCGVGGCTCV